MRHNHRPVLLASSLHPNMLSLHRGERPSMKCPDCCRWRVVHRGMLAAHRADDGTSRCPGSGQRLALDVSPGEWLVLLRAAVSQASGFRAPYSRLRTRPKPVPPVAVPPFRMPAA